MTEVMQILENLTQQIKNQTQQSENDRTTIQLLQNRVFFLEAELNKFNTSMSSSRQEFSTYLMSMNKLIQNMVANEENDKNMTHHLNTAVKQLDDLQHGLINQSSELEHYKQLSESDRSKVYLIQNFTQNIDKKLNDLRGNVFDLHTTMELLNGSLLQQLERRISDVQNHISASMNVIKKRFNNVELRLPNSACTCISKLICTLNQTTNQNGAVLYDFVYTSFMRLILVKIHKINA